MRRFKMVNVFSDHSFAGNPLGVVMDADGLSTEDMQRVARWLNLSETAFLLRPTTAAADYRVRIFSLPRELPFAGHPTLGSCHVWSEASGRATTAGVVQECAAGLVRVRPDAEGWAFAAPPLVRSGPVQQTLLHQLVRVLGVGPDDVVDARWVDNGPGWVAVLLKDAATVLALNPNFGNFEGEGSLDLGVVGPYEAGSSYAYELRAFFSGEHGEMREDPVTGSLNASVAQWMVQTGRCRTPYRVSQGTRLGRSGRPRIDQDEQGTIWVGGDTTTLIEGSINL